MLYSYSRPQNSFVDGLQPASLRLLSGFGCFLSFLSWVEEYEHWMLLECIVFLIAQVARNISAARSIFLKLANICPQGKGVLSCVGERFNHVCCHHYCWSEEVQGTKFQFHEWDQDSRNPFAKAPYTVHLGSCKSSVLCSSLVVPERLHSWNVESKGSRIRYFNLHLLLVCYCRHGCFLCRA
jgi:hypothetical protein